MSFTVRRPTPPSRMTPGNDSDGPVFKVPALPSRLASSNNSSNAPSPLSKFQTLNSNGKRPASAFDGDSDSGPEDNVVEELVVGFDAMGAQRAGGRPVKKDEPLVIAPLPNRDWRAVVKKNRNHGIPSYVPEGMEDKMKVGPDGSQGGLGTRDAINSGPQQSGLVIAAPVTKRRKIDDEKDVDVKREEVKTEDEQTLGPNQELTEDEKTVRAMLNAAQRAANGDADGPEMEAIPLLPSADWRQPKTEAEAFQEDVITRPDSCTLEDYQRVPVEQFGTALLRGMGWKPGTGASRSGKGPTEAFAPSSRPALLGLGAKEREAIDDGKKGRKKPTRPDMRYVPVVARERERSERLSESDRDHDRERRDRNRDRDRDGDDREYASSRRHSSERRSNREDRGMVRERDHNRDWESDHDRRRENESGRRERDRRRDEEEYDRRERDRRDDRGDRRSSRR